MEMTIDNLCNSCTNIGCEFQSGIVRTKCAFYMQPPVEAIPKADYETRLKADMVAMLEKLKLEIILQVIDEPTENGTIAEMASFNSGIVGSYDLIQQKINALKENTDG